MIRRYLDWLFRSAVSGFPRYLRFRWLVLVPLAVIVGLIYSLFWR